MAPSSHELFKEAAPGSGVRADHPAAAHVQILDRAQALVKHERQAVAITGFAASSKHMAPFDDPRWEVWGMNQLYRHIPRLDRQFDMHANWREGNVEGTDHPRWLRECGIPVYMAKEEEEIPTSLAYPLERMLKKHPKYFTSSVAYMMALAIEEGFKVIGIYGIDLIVGKEYDWQKACVEYFIGYASALGITVVVPENCALVKAPHLYGYEAEPQHILLPSEFAARRALIKQKLNQLIIDQATWDGASQELDYWSQILDLRIKGGMIPTNEVRLAAQASAAAAKKFEIPGLPPANSDGEGSTLENATKSTDAAQAVDVGAQAGGKEPT